MKISIGRAATRRPAARQGQGRPWRALWLAVAAATQFAWGAFPVFLRLFQTEVPHRWYPLTGLQLNLVINSLAVPGLLFCYSLRFCAWPRRRQAVLPRVLIAPRGAAPGAGREFEPLLTPPALRTPGGMRRVSLLEDTASSRADLQEAYRAALRVDRESAAAGSGSAAQEARTPSAEEPAGSGFGSLGSWGAAGGFTPPATRAGAEEPLLLGFSEEVEVALQEEHVSVTFQPALPLYRWFSPYALALATAAVLAALSLAVIFSVRLTQAHYCQMLFLLAPLMVAFLTRWLFRVPLPRSLWATLAAMLAGSAMVILGGQAAGGQEKHRLAWHDAAGLALALVSALSLAAFMILVQRTKDLVSEEALLWVNYGTQVVLSLALTLAFERRALPNLGRLPREEWAGLVALALCLHWGANFLQQVTIRQLSAPLVSMFLPTRLLGAVATSYALLGARLQTAWEWAGLLTVAATTTTYDHLL